MIFTTTSLFLAGLAAAAIPVAIHLASRGKPRKVVLTTLRFVKQTVASNRRKLRLKRLFLLALRCALLILLGFALARPIFAPSGGARVENENEDASGIPAKDEPVAAAIVIDSSVRMDRVKDNATLLERARAVAVKILERFPKGSELAILDGSTTGDGFQTDRYAAKTRAEKTEIEPGGRSAAESTLAALALLKSAKSTRREIYVLSDETTAGWSTRDVNRIRRAAEGGDKNRNATTNFYFVDLGDDAYRDVAILDASPSSETISVGVALRVDATIERVDPNAGEVAIEALFFNADDLPDAATPNELARLSDRAFRRESQTVAFEAGRARKTAVFNVASLPEGNCVGLIRALVKDALADDDARSFVVAVASKRESLVVAPRPAREKAVFLTQALAPDELKKTGRAPFELAVGSYDSSPNDAALGAPPSLSAASDADLRRYRAIFLLDPPPLSEETIAKLTRYASEGGGIAVFLGRAAAPVAAFQTPEAFKLLGVKPTTRESSDGLAIAPVSYDAPILAGFRPFARDGIPWDAAPVYRYWKFEEVADSATIVARFARSESGVGQDDPPAIVENEVGRGLVATIATPISDGAQEHPWNSLTTGDAVWVFITLVDGIARRLATSSSILNYATGETAALRPDPRDFPAVATVYLPTGEAIATPTDPERRQIRFPGVKTPGICRVRSAANRDGAALDLVFSVNAPGEEFDMARRSREEWDRLWDGLPCKTVAVDAAFGGLEDGERGDAEPYAFLVVALAVLFILETVVSNRFYKN